MSKEITLEDGTKETVYTEDEVAGFKAGDEKNKERKETLNQVKEKLGVGDGDDLLAKADAIKESNFGKYHKKHRAMEKDAKSRGKEFDDDGNDVSKAGEGEGEATQAPSMEDTRKIAADTTQEVLDNNTITSQISGYTEEQKTTIKNLYNKAKTLGGSLQENLDLAISKSVPNDTRSASANAFNRSGGGAPVIGAGNNKVSAEGEAMGKAFGNSKEDMEKVSSEINSVENL